MLFRDGLEKKFFIHRKRKKTDFYMRQLMNLWKGMASAVAGGLLLCACSAEEEAALTAEGKGLVRIGLSADTGFSTQTKAVDESSSSSITLIWDTGEGEQKIRYSSPDDDRIHTLTALLKELADPIGREIPRCDP